MICKISNIQTRESVRCSGEWWKGREKEKMVNWKNWKNWKKLGGRFCERKKGKERKEEKDQTRNQLDQNF